VEQTIAEGHSSCLAHEEHLTTAEAVDLCAAH
jgi:hypothetical protein